MKPVRHAQPDADSSARAKRKSALDPGLSNSKMATQQALARLRLAGVQVTEANHPLSLGQPITFTPLPDGKTMSELVLDMRDPRSAVLTSK